MTVLFVINYDLNLNMLEEYFKWVESTINHIVSMPGITEFHGYRMATGTSTMSVTIEFASMLDWESWYFNQEIQKILFEELPTYTTSRIIEVGPVITYPGPHPISEGVMD